MIINSIQIFPIKSLDRVRVNQVQVTTGQALEFDRRWAIHRKRDGRTVNGKKYPAVHQLRTSFELEQRMVRLQAPQQVEEQFALVGNLNPLNEYLSDYFGEAVEVSEDGHSGFPDHTTGNVGASLVSRQTLQLVGAWFDLPEEEVNRRMRMNFIVDAAAAFEEDQWLSQRKEKPNACNVGGVEVWPYKPCVRCPVPTRDSRNGAAIRGFQKAYMQRRLALQPQLLEHPLYAHAYMCGLVLIIPEISVGKTIQVGMPITPKTMV
ncbi:MAG: MOSC domain-containing protein [Aureispira sp.]